VTSLIIFNQMLFVQVHLSFSLYGVDDDEKSGNAKPVIQFQLLSVFLQSIGVVLTDIQDVVFKYVLMAFHSLSCP
jgi:hypothetical protein